MSSPPLLLPPPVDAPDHPWASYQQERNPLQRAGLLLAGRTPPATPPTFFPVAVADDDLLTAADIAQSDLRDAQVVLTAASPVAETFRVGEALHALRQSFLLAGAHTLAAPLWSSVQDGELLTAYYEHLGDAADPTAALQQAAQRVRQQHSHPYYWAGFQVVMRAPAAAKPPAQTR